MPSDRKASKKECPTCGLTVPAGFADDRCPHDGSILCCVAKKIEQDPLIGKLLLDRYLVLSVIGTGGWSQVYRVKHSGLNKDMALKVLHPHLLKHQGNVERFRREAESISRLNHQSIAQVYDFGMLEDGRPYMAMDYLQGDTLSALIERRGAMDWKRAVPLFIEALDGLGYAHRRGILHRDLKPSNFFILIEQASASDQQEQERVKILDFGLAKILFGDDKYEESLTSTGDWMGTPSYMSPEQCRSEPLDRRSDIYSFGYIMYEVLSGTKPFSATGLYEIIQAHLYQDPASLTSKNNSRPVPIPMELDAIVLKALAKSPVDRFVDASELSDALTCVLKGDTRQLSRIMNKGQKQPVVVPWTVVSGVGALCCTLVAGLVYWFINHPGTPPNKPPVAAQKSKIVVPERVDKKPTVSQTHAPVPQANNDERVKTLQSQVRKLQEQLKAKQVVVKPPLVPADATRDHAEKKQLLAPPNQIFPTAPAKSKVMAVAQNPSRLLTSPAFPQQAVATGQPGITSRSSSTQIQQYAGNRLQGSSSNSMSTTSYSPPAASSYSQASSSKSPRTARAKWWGRLPSATQSVLRADDSARANAVRLEEWFRRIGAYNYRVEDELRGLYAEAGDWQKSQTFVDDIFKHSFMDAFQLDQQMMTRSPQKAIGNLLHSAEASGQRKFLRSACLIKAGMLSAGLGRHSDAQRFLYQVASDHDSALSAYSSYATQQLQTLH